MIVTGRRRHPSALTTRRRPISAMRRLHTGVVGPCRPRARSLTDHDGLTRAALVEPNRLVTMFPLVSRVGSAGCVVFQADRAARRAGCGRHRLPPLL